MKPEDIEKRSMEIIDSELGETPRLSDRERIILKRVIHTTADFDYKENLCFSENAVSSGLSALLDGAVIVTDTHMAESGISKPAVKGLGCSLHCFMTDEDVVIRSKNEGITRASASMYKAAEMFCGKKLIFAIGNAPTALMTLTELVKSGKLVPALVIAAPVGFVNILESKEMITSCGVQYIAAMGRKGGSGVAAAICNALMYQVYSREKGTVTGI
ncbi:MAG: precorrin-8X methylmutase [Huintestinicola sp.]